MADIFISYAREDRQWAEMLSKAFETLGWSVWWDRRISAGEEFTEVIEQSLHASRCVIVLWSKASAKSRWVRDEANEGLERGILVPLQIDGTRPPLGFRSIHATSIAGWKGTPSGSKFELVQYDVSRILGPAPATQRKAEPIKENTYNIKGPSEEHFDWIVTWSKFSRNSVSWSVLGTLCVLVVTVFLLREPLGFQIGPKNGATDPPPDSVIAPDPDPEEIILPGVSFSVAESSIVNGKSTTLNWSVTNASEVRIVPDVGAVDSMGSERIKPENTISYRLIASGPGGEVEEVVTVQVTDPPPVTDPPIQVTLPPIGSPFTNSIGMDFVPVRANSYRMGSENGDEDEKPVHAVRITRDFYMGVTEVTQGQWLQVMNENPSEYKKGEHHPIESVSWDRVQAFIGEMNQRDQDYHYRLPTEAEWEFACRAGSTTEYYYGNNTALLDRYAVYGRKASHAEVKSKQPNAWGLYDMMGNVWEWTADWYAADYYGSSPRADPKGPAQGNRRVLRGGSFVGSDRVVRCSYRGRSLPNSLSGWGFRLVALPRSD